jgi:DNA-binding NarL/FixJ family response regulator
MRILLVDDHTVVRRGLRQILEGEYPRAVFGEADNARTALALVAAQQWDIVILDITMPGRSGLDALKDIKQVKPKLPVLILSMHPEDQYAPRVLRAGAAGYLTKDAVVEELVKAVQRITGGGRYVSARFAEWLAGSLQAPTSGERHANLSDREFQVLTLLAGGKTVKEAAAELSLSIKTVSTYRARLLEKLQLRTTAELMRYAVQHRLVE